MWYRDFLRETHAFLSLSWKYESACAQSGVSELESDKANKARDSLYKFPEALTWLELTWLWKLDDDS